MLGPRTPLFSPFEPMRYDPRFYRQPVADASHPFSDGAGRPDFLHRSTFALKPPDDKPAEAPADKPADPPPDNPTDTPAEKPADTPAEKPAATTFTPEQEAEIAKREKNAAARAKRAAEGERQTKEQEEQGRFKPLYEAAKPKAELADRLTERVNKQISAEVKDWPDEVKGLDPGEDDVEKRLEWAERSRALALRLKGTPPVAPDTEAGKGGSGNTPTGAHRAGDGAKADDKAPKPGERIASAAYPFQSKGDVSW